MRRRDFINFLSAAAAGWPISAHAQQLERPRQIGILIPFHDDEPEVKARLAAFKQRLHELGWIESRNIRFDYRFTGQDAERIRTGTEELIALGPDVIVVWGNPAVAILQKATQTIPIVFVGASDPVSTKTSITRTGLSSSIQSSKHSGNSVLCPRSVPSTKRLIRSLRKSSRNHTARIK